MASIASPSRELAAEVASTSWYHTLSLPGELRTPGFYDTLAAAGRLPFPPSLDGLRCLDVGTSDGFWAFEMERRGAAEVVAIDIDDPADYDWPEPTPERPARPANPDAGPNKGFEIAHRALGSSVQRIARSVYDLDEAEVGRFDFVFMGALMLHLRDPVSALAAIRLVTRGQFLSADSISLWATVTHPTSAAAALSAIGEPRWWTPNLIAYRRLIRAAGFRIVSSGGPFFVPFGRGFPPTRSLRAVRPRDLPSEVIFRLAIKPLGAPSAWARCLPA